MEVKGIFHPITDHEEPQRECRNSSTLSLTSTLDGVGVKRHAPAALLPGKRPGTVVQYGGLAQLPVWTGVGNLAPPPQEFDTRTVHPLVSPYTD